VRDRSRLWSERVIVERLTELHGRGVVITRKGLMDAGYSRLVHAINHFGGIRRARRLATLPRPMQQRRGQEREAVIGEILRRHGAGQPLSWSDIPAGLRRAAIRGFGSWKAAVIAAGLDYRRARAKARARGKAMGASPPRRG
jgi:hypothetical protein